jgi:hypothetical protein
MFGSTPGYALRKEATDDDRRHDPLVPVKIPWYPGLLRPGAMNWFTGFSISWNLIPCKPPLYSYGSCVGLFLGDVRAVVVDRRVDYPSLPRL